MSLLKRHGHINPCIALAERLRDNGLRVIFALHKSWTKFPRSAGFECVEAFEDSGKTVSEEENNESRLNYLEIILDTLRKPLIEKLDFISFLTDFNSNIKILDDHLKKLIAEIKPDIIINEWFFYLPSIEESNIPWIYFHTPSPHEIYHFYCESFPPPFAGFPIDSDPKSFKEYQEVYQNKRKDAMIKLQQSLKHNESLPSKGYLFLKSSPYLVVYAYPHYLDFDNNFKLPDRYFRIDSLIKENRQDETLIPSSFLSKPGKLIYFTLGSWLSGDTKIMKKLLSFMAKSKHKFIVSKGPKQEEIQLYDNMWGDKFLNQLQIIKLSDMVITHTGNNSLLECCYYGKPMIAMPVFFDQCDNAQRVHERKIGYRLNPYVVEEDQLLSTIDKVLEDKGIKQRLEKISLEMQNSKRMTQLIEKIKQMV
jgi:glycosyltransferase, MGT family